MPITTHKPLPWFKINPQARKCFDEVELRRLGESLKCKQLQPVLCQPDGTLIAGERRYRAAKLVGMETLEVKIADEMLAGPQVKLWQLTENMLRADLTGHEKWLGCTELMSLHPHWQMKDLAEHLHLDPSMVTRLLSPSKCIPAWREALKTGGVGISDVYVASKLPEAEQEALLVLKLSGASRDSIEQAGRKKRALEAPTPKLARVRCPLPTGALVVVSGPEMSLDGLIETLGLALDAAKKANKDSLDVKTAQAVWKDKAKHG